MGLGLLVLGWLHGFGVWLHGFGVPHGFQLAQGTAEPSFPSLREIPDRSSHSRVRDAQGSVLCSTELMLCGAASCSSS